MNTDQLWSCAYLENDFPFEIQSVKKLREIYTAVGNVRQPFALYHMALDMKPYTHLSDKMWAFKYTRLVFLEEIIMCNNTGETQYFLPTSLNQNLSILTLSLLFSLSVLVSQTFLLLFVG